MIRTALIVAATIATIAAASTAAAQTGAPVRSLGAPETATAATMIAARKAGPCADKSCSGKPTRRDTYVASAPLGW